MGATAPLPGCVGLDRLGGAEWAGHRRSLVGKKGGSDRVFPNVARPRFCVSIKVNVTKAWFSLPW